MTQFQIIIALLSITIALQISSFLVLMNLIINKGGIMEELFKRMMPLPGEAAPSPPEPSLTQPAPEPEKKPRPRQELEAELEAHWAGKPSDVRPVIEEVPCIPTKGEKVRAMMQKQADERGITVGQLMSERTAKRAPKEKSEQAPPFRKWKEGDRAIVKKEIAPALFTEEECLRVGTVVQVHSIKKLSAIVFDPKEPLRGVAEVDRGIGGWVISFRNLERIEEGAP